MKLIPNILKKLLPVSRAKHDAAIAAAKAESQAENAYVLGQLRQVTAANIRLERKLHGTEEA